MQPEGERRMRAEREGSWDINSSVGESTMCSFYANWCEISFSIPTTYSNTSLLKAQVLSLPRYSADKLIFRWESFGFIAICVLLQFALPINNSAIVEWIYDHNEGQRFDSPISARPMNKHYGPTHYYPFQHVFRANKRFTPRASRNVSQIWQQVNQTSHKFTTPPT